MLVYGGAGKVSQVQPPPAYTRLEHHGGEIRSSGKQGGGRGRKFISLLDGSTRPLNNMEKMHVTRETPCRRRKIFP
ncbi:hypothetical protein MLD38_017687 [Melastoma candidum]|uniref:Uncharacterized protein n=1 Tax=Melastoma candidum TaxID=119954 RepID=A0ACB9QZP2_9MYRT|nr:hypothetical protein MLD38_017687 [Melastoma candidum]